MRFVISLVAAFVIAGAAYGAATTLTVFGNNGLQQGSTNVVCDTDGVSLHYNTTYTGGELRLLKVFVDNLDASCAGGELDVFLYADGGTTLWWGASDVPPGFAGGTIQAGTAGTPIGTLTDLEPVDVDHIQVYVYDTYP